MASVLNKNLCNKVQNLNSEQWKLPNLESTSEIFVKLNDCIKILSFETISCLQMKIIILHQSLDSFSMLLKHKIVFIVLTTYITTNTLISL